jgi:hypothetical protein
MSFRFPFETVAYKFKYICIYIYIYIYKRTVPFSVSSVFRLFVCVCVVCVSVSVCMYVHVCMYIHTHIHTYIGTFIQTHTRTRKTELPKNGHFRLFVANGKRKRQNSVCLLQTETENRSLLTLVDKR